MITSFEQAMSAPDVFAPNPGPVSYQIIDKHTGGVVGTAKSRAAATRSVDRRDNAYGAYRYSARPVYA